MDNKYVKLYQPPLLDFSKIKKDDDVRIIIHNTTHKFATDAAPSGLDVKHQPIVGCKVLINGKKFLKTSFGLPFMRFPNGSTPKITYDNQTKLTFNIHHHGLNITGNLDGTNESVVFGPSTQLGPVVTFQYPKITNNQALLWNHAHQMFTSMELIYSGILGLIQVTDQQTEWLTEQFQYGDNQLLIAALDMDLDRNGVQTYANLVTDENRSCFTVVNGVSCVNWYSSKSVPFVNPLYHKSSRNLVKIDIGNFSLNWKIFHLGVCDENKHIKPFFIVQSDSGLINPKEVKMAFIPTASRIAIIIDLALFKSQTAYLFFYDYDLTEVLDSTPTYPDQPNNPTLTATIPDFQRANSTPYPSPIPDANQENQQQIYTNLDYPILPLIPQVEQVLENGVIQTPQKFNIKPWLKITSDHKKKQKVSKVLSLIRKTVFTRDTYHKFKDIIKYPCFEYDPKYNYLSFLNQNYFYNIPNFNDSVPTRNIFLFPETDLNTLEGGNPNGLTEYVNGANRLLSDLWNSSELNLEWAMQQYAAAPNNYKPPTLPTSKFRIYKTNDEYSNTAMISNDTLHIQFYEDEIAYGDHKQNPVTTVTVIFPPADLMNIEQWISLINSTFEQTMVTIPCRCPVPLSSLIKCDWSFFPYAMAFEYERVVYIKSAVIKTLNNSPYWVRLSARWPLLQLFGKPLTGDTLNSNMGDCHRKKQQHVHNKIRQRYSEALGYNYHPIKESLVQNKLDPVKNSAQFIKCDEEQIFGIYDNLVQQIFPYYATSNGNVQLPIACMKRSGELIIVPNQTYIGLYDGYLNDNLNSFSVKKKSTELWIYTNGDNADAHSLHFHLTSGFVLPQSCYNSPGLLKCKNLSNQLTYSRDIYQIGPNESIGFYLTWPHYSSDETTSSPNFRGLGGVIHCHFLVHNDANSMIGQYYVDPTD